jgi:spoIIIJ-associated protein
MSEQPASTELEAFGETVGEAKWQALRELERLYPGLDRDRVTFQVLAEGERGLLGVGTAPARVLARAELPPAGALPLRERSAAAAPGSLSELAETVVSRIAEAIGVHGAVSVSEAPGAVLVDVSGAEISLLIGRNGRTIDAVQLVVAAIGHRLDAEDERRIEVDAGGYRRRRRDRVAAEAHSAGRRVLASGQPVALAPMSSLERKLVHTTLEDVEGVETRSEGDEPARFVVVIPSAGSTGP